MPYNEVFDLDRFRETELIHGRWAMLAALGAVVAELSTGVSWVDAGKVELEQGSSYGGLPLPFDLTQLCILEAVLVGGVEVLRNRELDIEKRIYPGGAFDPLGLASGNQSEEQVFRLRTSEIKHGRLAMCALRGGGYALQKGSLFVMICRVLTCTPQGRLLRIRRAGGRHRHRLAARQLGGCGASKHVVSCALSLRRSLLIPQFAKAEAAV